MGQPKKIPCPGCQGSGRILGEVPLGWVQRTFLDEEPCECARETKQRIALAVREGKAREKMIPCAKCGLPRKAHWPLHDVRHGECSLEMFEVPLGDPENPPTVRDVLGPELSRVLHCEKCAGAGRREISEIRWAWIEPFLPNAWQQVLRYIKFQESQERSQLMEKFQMKHPGCSPGEAESYAGRNAKWSVPRDYKTGKETTGEADLRRLGTKTGDLVIPLVLEYREVNKLRGTYVQGWKPSGITEFSEEILHENEDGSVIASSNVIITRKVGRVHPSFGFRPATGQLSSENPNGQNFPVHSQLAHKMKSMLVAEPGSVLINFDYKSFHVLTLGFEAQDPLYMRMARNDMHSFFALCGLLKLEPPEKVVELPDGELRLKLKWYRKQPTTFSQFGGYTFDQVRNEKAKKAILGIGFGQMERSLYMLNPESYSNIAEAKLVLEMLDELFPLPAKWRQKVRLLADEQHYLVTRHGYIRRFWDVFHRRPVSPNYEPRRGDFIYLDRRGQKWVKKPGDDHESCIALLASNDAFGTIRSVMIKLTEKGLDERFQLTNQIHDSLVFNCPIARKEECLEVVRREMEAPNLYLTDPKVAPDGLSCQAEAKIGPDLDSMEEYVFPG